jgi:2-polyprenyl-6-hydroxyphenyl methylase/3-demethylubiquinone-9 3-methyltransferase
MRRIGGKIVDDSYYSKKLSAARLKRCYDLAPPPVQRYCAAENEYVLERIHPGDRILELGCGYGRVLKELAPAAGHLVGIDTSIDSLRLATHYLGDARNLSLVQMNAVELTFAAESFDLVCCIQNGVSAFHVDQQALFRGAVRVCKKGGTVLFSTYAAEFWEDRLHWFRIQAKHGLLGEIDEEATGDGVIVCKDGFTATTLLPDELLALSLGLGAKTRVEVVAGSSVFCEIVA